ncbi:hypothetical protein WR25_06813 [Diploscapter pachys]|uniref:Cytochrome P450 n=1 Tax=Diploscapter pachys TaxID=2018661 RepID=A0A2A2LNB6_9BILA|nr:hypothetical protein WR25_06813 [Diploscapter pachys]
MVKKGQFFVDRWEPPIAAAMNDGKGLASSSGDYWVEQRRFALHTLRNLGVSRNIMEERIMEEFHLRFDNIKSDDVICAQDTFDLFTANVINRILYSYGFDEKNQERYFDLRKRMDEGNKNFSFIDACIPDVLLKIPYFKKRSEELMKPFNEVKDFLREQIVERMEAIESGKHEVDSEPNDFVDAFIVEMKRLEDNNQKSSFDLETLVADVLDLFIAGQDTTSNTLAWTVCFLMNAPDVIAKLREEVRSVTGGNRDLSQADKPNTPYLNAVINESQRLANIVPLNLFRKASEDVEVGGVVIRKGQVATALIGNIMCDEKYFKDAARFNPERYLLGEKLEAQTLPFSLGKRACLGESLARAELYLILGNLTQRYTLEVADSMPVAESENLNAFIRRPTPYNIRLVEIE